MRAHLAQNVRGRFYRNRSRIRDPDLVFSNVPRTSLECFVSTVLEGAIRLPQGGFDGRHGSNIDVVIAERLVSGATGSLRGSHWVVVRPPHGGVKTIDPVDDPLWIRRWAAAACDKGYETTPPCIRQPSTASKTARQPSNRSSRRAM